MTSAPTVNPCCACAASAKASIDRIIGRNAETRRGRMRLTLTHGSAAAGVLATFVMLLPLTARAQTPARSPSRPADDPFARRAWTLELSGYGALETWNYNSSHEEM